MVNIQKLRAAMKKQNVDPEKAANAMQMDVSTFYRKLGNNGARFTVEQVEKMSQLLGLSSRELQEIFFEAKLA